MTREEFISANGDKPLAACYHLRTNAMKWAQTFSTWDETTWLAVACDGWYATMTADQYQPWVGRIIARYQDGKRVSQ